MQYSNAASAVNRWRTGLALGQHVVTPEALDKRCGTAYSTNSAVQQRSDPPDKLSARKGAENPKRWTARKRVLADTAMLCYSAVQPDSNGAVSKAGDTVQHDRVAVRKTQNCRRYAVTHAKANPPSVTSGGALSVHDARRTGGKMGPASNETPRRLKHPKPITTRSRQGSGARRYAQAGSKALRLVDGVG